MIAALVLAAGASKRLGRPKQLIELDGRTLVERTATACLEGGCSPVVVTVGHAADDVRRALAGTAVTIIDSVGWREGIAASIRAGLAAVGERSQAVVLAVCDQPALSSAVIRRLVEAWDGDPKGRVACAYAGILGVPVLFARGWFEELARLRGERGAQALLAFECERVRRIDWQAGERDIDRVEDAGPRLESPDGLPYNRRRDRTGGDQR